ncbi:MAG: hypothetical protein OEM83_02430 [Gammaproteobacteria bacterium]|nr:hypothetical protein [Gammaproteobacteria bacterium]MDH5512474.1 hypothetical protein [Gammaproteobacteria bacterium]
MTPARIVRATQVFGMLAIVAGFFVTGCQRNPEATATAPAMSRPPAHAMDTSDIKHSADAAATALKVTVSLSPALEKKAAPDDVVFIFARAKEGPRMPLAIVRKQVKDLPATVVLDDSQGMGPHSTLSNVPELVVIARVSKSGTADARDGDLEGVSVPVPTGTRTLSISIDKVLTGQKAPSMPSGKL